MSLDAALGSGLLLGEGDDGTAVGRTPLYLEFEAGFVFDGDTQFEYVLGTTVQLETRPAVGFTPQIRVLQPFGTVVLPDGQEVAAKTAGAVIDQGQWVVVIRQETFGLLVSPAEPETVDAIELG